MAAMPRKRVPLEERGEQETGMLRVARILDLPVPTAAKSVLITLARYGNWETGDDCRPGIETIARSTSLSERHVQRLLRYLACRPGTPCFGGRGCPHWGLIELTSFATYGTAATWRLNLDPTMFQLTMPEVGNAAAAGLLPLELKGCQHPGCERPRHARGLCDSHYRRERRRGSSEHEGRQPIFGATRPRGVGLDRGQVDNPRHAGGEEPAPAWKERTA